MLFKRIVGVFQLNPGTFEEIEHDQTATGQAALVVTLVSILNGLGAGLLSQMGGTEFLPTFLTSIFWGYAGWIIWSGITYLLGVRLFAGRADMGEMLRVTGFAMAPLALGIIPFCGGIIGVLWAGMAIFIAIRQGLDLDSGRALLTMLVGGLIYMAGYFWIYALSGVAQSFLA